MRAYRTGFNGASLDRHNGTMGFQNHVLRVGTKDKFTDLLFFFNADNDFISAMILRELHEVIAGR